MKHFSYFIPALIALVSVSCFPFPPYYNDPHHPQHPPQQQNQQPDEPENQLPDGQTSNDTQNPYGFHDPSNTNGNQNFNPPPENQTKPSIPVARSVPGKPGAVFSPFNNKIIDVKDFPSGTVVADPNYPRSEKKHFRVP